MSYIKAFIKNISELGESHTKVDIIRIHSVHPIAIRIIHDAIAHPKRHKPAIWIKSPTMMTRCCWQCSDEFTNLVNPFSWYFIGSTTRTCESKLYRLFFLSSITEKELLFTLPIIKNIIISYYHYKLLHIIIRPNLLFPLISGCAIFSGDFSFSSTTCLNFPGLMPNNDMKVCLQTSISSAPTL